MQSVSSQRMPILEFRSVGALAALLAAILLPGRLGLAEGEGPPEGASPPAPAPEPAPAAPAEPAGGAAIPPPSPEVRDIDVGPHRTLRAGEGFRTEVAGHKVDEQPRDRRSLSAFDLGLEILTPPIRSSEVTPFGALYFWRRPDLDTFFRAIVVGLYNDVELTKTTEGFRPLELVFNFNSYTVPVAQTEAVDGQKVYEEELVWGRLRGGAGLGLREPLDFPGADKIMNMAAVYLTAEPGYLYFSHGDETADNFTVPQDTFEMRGHLKARYDHMERNLFELAHKGFVVGSDLYYGWRSNWEDWGTNRSERASVSRSFGIISGYVAGATGVPFVESERHRLLGYVYAGTGSGLDRFSGFRLGGGPSGDEYEAISRPLVPGSALEEYITDHYVIAIGEYRWEPIFFLYPSLRTSVSYLERRRVEGGQFTTSDDVLPSVGLRITTGFLFRTQLQIDYNYGFGVIRDHEYGGHEIMVHISGQL
jgi:hypothetical protein